MQQKIDDETISELQQDLDDLYVQQNEFDEKKMYGEDFRKNIRQFKRKWLKQKYYKE